MNRQTDGHDDYNRNVFSLLSNLHERYIANFINTVKAGAHNDVDQKAEEFSSTFWSMSLWVPGECCNYCMLRQSN